MAKSFGFHPLQSFRMLIWAIVFGTCLGLSLFEKVEGYELGGPAGECGSRELEHSDPGEAWIYGHILPHLHRAEQGHVALLTLSRPDVPLNFFRNACDGRRLFSLLIPSIASYGPRVIAIDKFYSEDACADQSINDNFRQVINQVARTIPVVVGLAAQEPEPSAEKNPNGDCLTLIQPLGFTGPFRATRVSTPGQVHLGLTRLNENTLQVPLAWAVRDAGDKKLTLIPGFALTAAEQADQSLARNSYITRYAAEPEQRHHPFASFAKGMPSWSVMDILCSSPDDILSAHHLGTCVGRRKQSVSLEDKVVVIGEHVPSDLQPFPGGSKYGMELQASYIDALVSRRFLRELPYGWDWLEVFVTVAIPVALELFGERLPIPWLSKDLRLYKSSKRVFVILGLTFAFWILFLGIDASLLLFCGLYSPVFVLSLIPIGSGLVLSFLPSLVTDLRDVRNNKEEAA